MNAHAARTYFLTALVAWNCIAVFEGARSVTGQSAAGILVCGAGVAMFTYLLLHVRAIVKLPDDFAGAMYKIFWVLAILCNYATAGLGNHALLGEAPQGISYYLVVGLLTLITSTAPMFWSFRRTLEEENTHAAHSPLQFPQRRAS